MDFAPVETCSTQELSLAATTTVALPPAPETDPNASKRAIRNSLRASSWDGVFAAIFSNVAGGVLLSNLLVELHATPMEIGMLSSIPMLVNLVQPLGAYLSNRTTSRHWYCFWVYAPSRLLWLFLAVGIAIAPWQHLSSSQLVRLTLAIVLLSHTLGALGSASWLSWLAALVPRRLRGRYFGIRNSAASLTNLVSVPLLGLFVSKWNSGSLEGYSIILVLGVVAGLISLGFQFLMVDVNPQVQQSTLSTPKPFSTDHAATTDSTDRYVAVDSVSALDDQSSRGILHDFNFLRFLLYFGGWMFAVNLSAPFFNLYLLDNLALDVSWVTLYNSLHSGAYLVMLILWGKLADRIGNRSILILIGIGVALTPLLWLGIGTDSLSVWVWLPLLHLLTGGTWAAIDLCNNNMQLGVAPVQRQATYFAIAAALAGVSGALGTTVGGFLAQFADYGGLPGLFALSSILRLTALVPLVFVHEQRGQSLRQMMRILFTDKLQSNPEG